MDIYKKSAPPPNVVSWDRAWPSRNPYLPHISWHTESKFSVDEVSKLDAKNQAAEKSNVKNLKQNSDMEKKFSELEDHFTENKAGDNTEKDNAIADEDRIKFVVQEEINRKSVEEQDTERRKSNIIIYRVPENKTDNVTERKLSDTVYVKDLLAELGLIR